MTIYATGFRICDKNLLKIVNMLDPVRGGHGKALFVAVFYFTCSISMNFLNKAVVSSYDFNYPFFIMSCQMLATVIFLDISRLLKISKLNTYSLKDGVDFLPASLSFALHSTLSLIALHGMNIPMYSAIKVRNQCHSTLMIDMVINLRIFLRYQA